jgi:hypothetical protein
VTAKAWRTRDGRSIPIKDMDDGHLENCVRFLRRAHRRYVDDMAANPPTGFQGEMAQYYADQEWSAAMSSKPSDLYPILDALVEELALRAAKNGQSVPPVVRSE